MPHTLRANAVVPFPEKAVRRRDHELAFLPAALEIVETPPSPIGRAIGMTVVAVFCLALAWASFGTVDIVATAPKDHSERPHQGDSAVRDRCGARNPRARRSECQGW